MIPAGKHPARAISHEYGITPNKGTKFVRVQFELLSGEHSGQVVSWDGWFTEKTLERTMDSLENCGWDGVSLSNPQGIGSKDCVVDIEHEEHEGKTYARVKWVNRPGGSKLKEEMRLDEHTVSSLDQEFRASLLERRQKSGSRPAQRPTPRTNGTQRPARSANDDFGPMPDDGDIPF